MRELAVLENVRAAQAYLDYMQTQGIACTMEREEDSARVFVVNDADAEQALTVLRHFVQHPNDPKYHQASWELGQTDRGDLNYQGGGWLIIRNFLFHAGPLTLSVFVTCLVLYVLMNLGFFRPIYEALSFFPNFADMQSMQVWRFFSPTLLHFSVLHIVFNLLWWWHLGGLIEQHKGANKLLTLFIVASILPNTIQFMMVGPNFGGLSGVVYALAGYVWLAGKRDPEQGLGLPNPLMGFMLFWLVLGFMDIIGPSMANLVHLFGLAAGLLVAYLDYPKRSA